MGVCLLLRNLEGVVATGHVLRPTVAHQWTFVPTGHARTSVAAGPILAFSQRPTVKGRKSTLMRQVVQQLVQTLCVCFVLIMKESRDRLQICFH